MKFADELRNGKGLETQKWAPTQQDSRDIKNILEVLKDEAIKRNRTGNSSVKVYLGYYGYDKNYWHLRSAEAKILEHEFSGIKSGNEEYTVFLQSEISKGLRNLGFTKISVQPEMVQLYRKEPGFFRDWKIVKGRCAKTMKIEFFW